MWKNLRNISLIVGRCKDHVLMGGMTSVYLGGVEIYLRERSKKPSLRKAR